MTDDPNLLFQGQDKRKLSFPAAAKLHNDVKPRILGYSTTLYKRNYDFFSYFGGRVAFYQNTAKLFLQ